VAWTEGEARGFVADFDHHDSRFVVEPWPVYAEARRSCPVVRSERYGGFWLVTRYEELKAVAKEWQTFTSSVPNVTAIPSSHPRMEPDLPIEVDPPLHTRYRQLVAPVFTRHYVASLKPKVRELAGGLLDRILDAGGGDLVSGFATPLSVGTLALFMDLPDEDHGRWANWVRSMYDPRDQEAAHAATREFFAYCDELVAGRRGEFVRMLLESEVEGSRLAEQDVAQFMRVLLIAGHETTAASMSHALRYLAECPGERRRLREDPGLIPTAVEELLRYFSVVTLQGRNATRDVVLAGAEIAAGDVVALGFAAANHDERAFPEPERCLLDRTPNRHVAFGFGPHICLGAHVARLELAVMLELVGERVGELALAPGEQPRWNSTGSVRGLATLPFLARRRPVAAECRERRGPRLRAAEHCLGEVAVMSRRR
jgi:cytochrome P450